LNRARLAWAALAVVVVVVLVVAFTGGGDESTSPNKQVDAIARTVRCPTCRGQSVAESAAPAAAAIKTEIRRRIDEGQSRQQIEDYLEGRYGSDILLTPPKNGIGGLVWILPVVALVGAATGLGLALRRWSGRALAHASEADRAMVERQL
jgi:cytochrome c-type biogenesis protein CcmH